MVGVRGGGGIGVVGSMARVKGVVGVKEWWGLGVMGGQGVGSRGWWGSGVVWESGVGV